MKKLNLFKLAVLSFAFSVIGFTSCVDPVEETVVDHYKVMTDYMKANNMDLNKMTDAWVVDAPTVNTTGISTYHILDIRAAADFALGHIPGAVNTTMANVVTAAAGVTKPILVVCYTGQNAAVANVALRLSGFPTSKILKWGMTSWNPMFDKITANISNQAKGHANWSTTNTIKTPVLFALPKLAATEFAAGDTTGAKILAKRVNYMLSQGFKGLDAATVLTTPANYFIVNYWTEADVNVYGHIKGAYRLNETLLLGDGMKNLDPAAKVVVYCWTGQTSALVTAYLNVLGYDASGIKFGTNAMINADLLKNKFSASQIGNYTYATGN
jgi:rhodanese-related sulfurtransferase